MSDLPLQPGDTYNRKIVVRDFERLPVEADSLPTALVYRNGAPSSPVIVVAVTELSGPAEYNLSFAIPGNAINTDSWQFLISAVVNGQAIERWAHITQTLFLGDSVQRGFTIRNSAGVGQAADALPAGTVIRNNADQATSVTIADTGSPNDGRYTFSFIVDAGWSPEDELQMRLSATVDGVAIERLLFLGQIITVDSLTITTLNVLDDEKPITLVDEEVGLTLVDEEKPIILGCE
ncbi:MAG: hypothetical protein GY794_16285 [bacterium]|nr:hypothetical protein [bacterium]